MDEDGSHLHGILCASEAVRWNLKKKVTDGIKQETAPT